MLIHSLSRRGARPVIRIASIQQPPERIVIDTSQPTIVPPPTWSGTQFQVRHRDCNRTLSGSVSDGS